MAAESRGAFTALRPRITVLGKDEVLRGALWAVLPRSVARNVARAGDPRGPDLLDSELVVVLLGDIDAKLTRSVTEIEHMDCGPPLLVIARSDVPSLRTLALLPPCTLVLYPEETSRLREALAVTLSASPSTAFLRAVLTSSGRIPPLLQRALQLSTQRGPLHDKGVPLTLEDSEAPLRTVKGVADKLGVSSSYLSNAASNAGFYLGRFVRYNVLLRGLALRTGLELNWTEIATRLGWHSPSGWSHFVHRLTAVSPSEAALVPLNRWIERGLEATLKTPGRAS